MPVPDLAHLETDFNLLRAFSRGRTLIAIHEDRRLACEQTEH
jgi:hypothetical protein